MPLISVTISTPPGRSTSKACCSTRAGSATWCRDSAARSYLSASTLSRIETGHRRVALEQLVAITKALGTSLDQLVEPEGNDDVVIRPQAESMGGTMVWLLSRERDRRGVTIAKMRFTEDQAQSDQQVHPGYEWFTVLSGVVRLHLGTRTILVHAGEAAEFSTMTPHSLQAHQGPAEILTIFDHDGEQAHLPGHRHRSSLQRTTPYPEDTPSDDG